MGFNLGKTLSHAGKSVSHAFSDTGHSVSKAGKSISHAFKNTGHTIGKTVGTVYKDGKGAVSGVYKDGKSAVSYSGKHLINDVDNISSALSSPMTMIVIGVVGVGVILLLTRK